MIKEFTNEVIIGLEVHIELDTNSKLFCACATRGSDEPNSLTCDVCLGFPGSKPVLNRKAVDYALRLCLALECKIAPELIFSRKSYFYPDMAKNYQITQYELPLGEKGKLVLSDEKTVDITRVHIEEDPAAITHPSGMVGSSFVLVDYNRSGRPLCEVVTEPDIETPEQAREFMKQLINILKYIKIFDINDCIIKADANISIKESGYTKVEVKNITGFKEIENALKYEISRQKNAVKNGEKIVQETRAWDVGACLTRSLRTKETAEDYGYILDPDLVITDITEGWINKVKESLPELHFEKAKRFVNEYAISAEDAKVLTLNYGLASFFDEVAKVSDPVLAAKWVRRELVRVLNYNELDFSDIKFSTAHFVQILDMVSKKVISESVGKKILEKLIVEDFDVKEYVRNESLELVSDNNLLLEMSKKIVLENPKVVEEYKSGKEQALNYLVGQVMKMTKGKASAQEIKKIITEII